jgi:peptide deformylase
MAIRNILKDGEPTLKKRSREVLNFDRRLHILRDDMAETMEKADGAGLAAPQVGVLRRVVVVAGPDGIIELINPEIIETEGKQEGAEGCLSFPGIYGIVTRPAKAAVKAQNRYGKTFTVSGEGIVARAFCHEVDHLDGIVFTDKVERYLTEEELRSISSGGGEEEIEI